VSVGCCVGMTPTPSAGSSLSCQLHAAGLHAAAANCSSKRSSTNFSTSSADNHEDVSCMSVDVGNDGIQRRASPSPAADRLCQPPSISADDVIDAFPVGDGHPSRRSTDTGDQLPAEADAGTKATSDRVSRSTSMTMNGDNNGSVSGTMPSARSAPRTWSCNASDVILSSLYQRGDVDRGVIASTSCVNPLN